ncbi:hypothetical protein GCM10023191_078280 [Actinoallomurus oryzae]|uniref:Knr4/Smi1-like domain-containing protein n=1 Tax=Actinoallomurus oryzae TaxID=502180 RepID=A0ABP8QXB2_9ACTN
MTDDDTIEAIRRATDSEKLPAPASEVGISEAERVIGYPLPTLLRRIYLEVANGGLGPHGYGILGVPGVEWTDDGYYGEWVDVIDVYRAFSAPDPDLPSSHDVPPYMVWLFDWGCAIWSLVDCRDERGQMWGWDPNSRFEDPLFPSNMTLSEWFRKWLDGNLELPCRGQSFDTRSDR